jgi:hypothetical protein
MRVPVLDTNQTPLMPTTPARARLLLKQGEAKPYGNKPGIFCIILTYAVDPDNQPLVVEIDPGSSFDGWSVVGTTLKGRVSLHNRITGGRVTQTAKVEDCTILTRIAWRTEWYAGMSRRHSSPA